MWPFGYRALLRSRWMALFWAVGICWTAVQVAGWSGDGNEGAGTIAAANGSDADLGALEQQVHNFEAAH